MTPEEKHIAEILFKLARDAMPSAYARGSYIIIHYDEIENKTTSDWLLCETNESIQALTNEIIHIIKKMDMKTITIREVKNEN